MADIARTLSTRPPQEIFRIQELSGRRRDLQLSGSTGPLRPLPVGGEQRRVTTYYAGNPQASRQVLGPKHVDTEVKGMLRARRTFYEPALVREGAGFRELSTPIKIVQELESIGEEGQDVRVTWSRIVRVGTLATWKFEWDREEDVAYTLTFDWSSRGERLPRANSAPRAVGGVSALEAAMSAFVDAVNEVNRVDQAAEDIADGVVRAARRVQAAVSRATALAARTVRAAKLPLDVINSFSAIAVNIKAQTIAVADEVDTPVEFMTTSNNVDRMVAAYSTFHTSRVAGERCEREARRGVDARTRDVRPQYLDVVVGREGQSLRTLARRYYGDADSWQIIADANGLEGSVLSGGEVIIIPVRR